MRALSIWVYNLSVQHTGNKKRVLFSLKSARQESVILLVSTTAKIEYYYWERLDRRMIRIKGMLGAGIERTSGLVLLARFH